MRSSILYTAPRRSCAGSTNARDKPSEGLRPGAARPRPRPRRTGQRGAILDAGRKPILIERLLSKKDWKGVRLCRPPDKVRESCKSSRAASRGLSQSVPCPDCDLTSARSDPAFVATAARMAVIDPDLLCAYSIGVFRCRTADAEKYSGRAAPSRDLEQRFRLLAARLRGPFGGRPHGYLQHRFAEFFAALLPNGGDGSPQIERYICSLRATPFDRLRRTRPGRCLYGLLSGPHFRESSSASPGRLEGRACWLFARLRSRIPPARLPVHARALPASGNWIAQGSYFDLLSAPLLVRPDGSEGGRRGSWSRRTRGRVRRPRRRSAPIRRARWIAASERHRAAFGPGS